MRGLRPQAQWGIHSYNHLLQAHPTQSQAQKIIAFCQQFPQHASDFIAISLQVAPKTELSPLTRVETVEALTEVVRQVTQAGYCFMDVISDTKNSYKGWISWITIGMADHGYLIDALALHPYMKKLTPIIEDPSILKYCYRLLPLLQAIKRDWLAFGCNFLDFQLFQKSIGVKRGAQIHTPFLSNRPPSKQFLEQVQQRYDLMLKYVTQMRGCLQEQPQQFRTYAYSNHYEILLKEYRHLVPTLEEEEKREMNERDRWREGKENLFGNEQEGAEEEEMKLEGERECSVTQMVLDWRQHMARLMDVPPYQLLSFTNIVKIAKLRPNSILQLEGLLREQRSFGLELYPKILQILELESELKQNDSNELHMKALRKPKQNNMGCLLAELGWQCGEEWLNRRNDESIKLYKEIVSVMEMDGSVVEEYLDGMEGGGFGKEDIHRFVKYAEFMRKGDHAELQRYHQNWHQSSKQSEWQLYQDEPIEETEHEQIKISLLSTSLGSILELEKHFDKGEGPTLASIHPSGLSLSSLHELTHQVEPLPDTMEAIYLKAASVKKGYSKTQKKKSRKQGREEQGFVPSWDDLHCLIEA